VKTALSLIVAIAMTTMTSSAQPAPTSSKPRILVHLTSGPENPTKAALAFLVARTAIEQGHAVSLFLAGDAVQLLRDAALDNVTGLGTGKLRDHFDAIAAGGGRFYLSGMSSSARGITAAELQGKPAELSPPAILLKLALEHDRMFTY
jgi:predicted peroxiredoxin